LEHRQHGRLRADDLEATREEGQSLPRLVGEQPQRRRVLAEREHGAGLAADVQQRNDPALATHRPVLVAGRGQGVAQHQCHQVDVQDRVAVEPAEHLRQIGRVETIQRERSDARVRHHQTIFSKTESTRRSKPSSRLLRGRSSVTGRSATTRPGREESTTTRSAINTASSMMCVTMTTVRTGRS
jgi:hypothetical protein